MKGCKKALCESDALEVIALCDRKESAQQELKQVQKNISKEMQVLREKEAILKNELFELSDRELAKQYGCSRFVIFRIRNGRAYAKKQRTGHQNIRAALSGSFQVTVKHKYIGSFKNIAIAVSYRDAYREKNNLPPADY